MICSPRYYIWKLVIALFAIAMIPYAVAFRGPKVLMFLTFWSWCVLALYFSVCVIRCLLHKPPAGALFLQELSFTLTNLVTCMTFQCLFGPLTDLFYEIVFHVINSVIMWTDIICYPIRFKFWHIIPLIIFGIVYFAANGIAYAITGRYQYPILTWQSVNTLWWFLLVNVIIFAIFVLGYYVTKGICCRREKKALLQCKPTRRQVCR